MKKTSVHRERRSFWILALAVATLLFPVLAERTVGEERKFVVMLAIPPKSVGAEYPPDDLPFADDIFDQYFDDTKHDVDSFNEYWQEISYGEVSVAGDVFGWVAIPWPLLPAGGGLAIPFTDLNNSDTFNQFRGERIDQSRQMYRIDYNGDITGTGTAPGDLSEVEVWPPGLEDFDTNGFPVWTPGERFRDLNGNGRYDALLEDTADGFGGTDLSLPNCDVKRDGEIEDDEFCHADEDDEFDFPEPFEDFLVIYEPRPTDPTLRWIKLDPSDRNLNTNGPEVKGSRQWAELYIRQNYPGDADALIARCGNGQYDGPDAWEERGNTKLQRRPSARMDELLVSTPEPDLGWGYKVPYADTSGLPNWWEQYWRDVHLSQGVLPPPTPQAPQWPEFDGIPSFALFDPANPGAGSDASVVRSFNPNTGGEFARQDMSTRVCIPDPRVDPLVACTAPPPDNPVDPEGDGELGTGRMDDGSTGVGPIFPDETGYYDGPVEYQDLPSSIYHTRSFFLPFDIDTNGDMVIAADGSETISPPNYSGFDYLTFRWYGGDGRLGEVTSPFNTAAFGQDIGTHNPGSGSGPDGEIPPAGPFAFNIHGANGWDAGNLLTLEFLTWRTESPTSPWMKRDFNLDGLIDQGEVVDEGTENYARDWTEFTPNDGGPASNYPYNRRRVTEDTVEALDGSVDWDSLIMPADFELDLDTDGVPDLTLTLNFLHSTFLIPAGLVEPGIAAGGRGLFQLPAPAMDLPIQIEEDPGVPLSPIWFSDFGTALGDVGEAGGDVSGFGKGLMAHEWLHVWEGYPDLYDYDVYIGEIENYPVGIWDIMSGAFVHPSPILKERGVGSFFLGTDHAPWIDVTNIIDVLTPWEETDVVLTDYAFDPANSVFFYDNQNAPGERFYFYRLTRVEPDPLEQFVPNVINFSKYLPGDGMMIMHTDLQSNPEGLPLQQRIGTHFIYYIVQADGLQQMDQGEAGGNPGDEGDPFTGEPRPGDGDDWPGWLEHGTDPDSKWWSQVRSGIEVHKIVTQPKQSIVTFFWRPRLTPEFEFINPPGGSILSGSYRLRYSSFDIYGGTHIEFYYDTDGKDYDGVLITNPSGESFATKQPGFIAQATWPVPLSSLPGDGTYFFYARMVPAPGEDGRIDPLYSTPRANPNNKGRGRFDSSVTTNGIDVDIDASKIETWRVSCKDDAFPGAEIWDVHGQLSGEQDTATTGIPYTTSNGEISFTITWTGTPGDGANVTDTAGEFLLIDPDASFVATQFKSGDVVRITSGPQLGFFTILSVPGPTTLRLGQDPGHSGGSGTVAYRIRSFFDGDALASGQILPPDSYSFITTGKSAYSVPIVFESDTIVPTLFPELTFTYRETDDPDVLPVRVEFDGSETRDEFYELNDTLEFTWIFGDDETYTPDDCEDDTGSRNCPTVEHVYGFGPTGFPVLPSGFANVIMAVQNPASGVSGEERIEIQVGRPDHDLDGVEDALDNCTCTNGFCPEFFNPAQQDEDGDGAGDICDGCPNDRFKTEPGVCGCGAIEDPPDCPPDCNGNRVRDDQDIAGGTSTDFDGSGVPDECEDCDGNGIADACDLSCAGGCAAAAGCGAAADCNDNDVLDECDIADGASRDCQLNGVPDECDIAGGTSSDLEDNGIPDECEDCNENGIPDPDDIAAGTSKDCNHNGIPDECEVDFDGDGLIDPCDGCPGDPRKTAPGACGCGVADADLDGDGTPNCRDLCVLDKTKTTPGACGCGVPDTDTDKDSVPDCIDVCSNGDDKIDTDGDDTPNCADECPNDPDSVEEGPCGCGVEPDDPDSDGVPHCTDNCPMTANANQVDGDDDGFGDACDGCPADSRKTAVGICGCGVADTDTDHDGTADCIDNCPDLSNPNQADVDGDQLGDVCDACPNDSTKTVPGVCGCGAPDVDSDFDGVLDCNDNCPGTQPGGTVDPDGCEVEQPEEPEPIPDSDGDGVADDLDECPGTPAGEIVGTNGCPTTIPEGPEEPPVIECGDGSTCGTMSAASVLLLMLGLGRMKIRSSRRRR